MVEVRRIAKATLLHVRRRSHFTGVNAKLVIGGVITGTVRARRPSGPGLGGVCVIASGRGRAAGIFQHAVSHKGGSYRISGLGTGGYRVQFVPQCGAKGSYLGRTHKGLVAVTDGRTTRGVNALLLPAAEISGTVTAAQGGLRLVGICVFAFPAFTGQGHVAIAGDVIQTGRQGRYAITGLRPGRYVMSFSGGCGNSGSYARSTTRASSQEPPPIRSRSRWGSTRRESTRACSRVARSRELSPIGLGQRFPGSAPLPPRRRTRATWATARMAY
jgi:hypothetical protein